MGRLCWTTTALVVILACRILAAAGLAQDKKKEIEVLKETGLFAADSPKDKVKTDCPGKPYPLPCVAGRTYTIFLRSDDFDAYLRLEDPSGKTILEDDDSGGGKNGHDARIIFKAEKAGTFTVAATSFDSGAKGQYTLTVMHNGIGRDVEIAYLLDVTARLTKDDPKDKDRGNVCYYKSYKTPMQAGKEFIIELDSRDFDAYLRLLDPSGKEVASDDDGAKDGLNAKLDYKCQTAGIYTVVATSSRYPDTGEFHLRVYAKN